MTDNAIAHDMRCPHCSAQTNAQYRFHPALNCWNCGGVMWLDERGRTIDQRGKLASAGVDLNDTPNDIERTRLADRWLTDG